MTPAEAAQTWMQRQAAILRKTYEAAWRSGAQSFSSETATPVVSATAARTPPPKQPSPAEMRKALGPAMVSLANMAAAIAALPTTAAAVTAAGEVTLVSLLTGYLKSNAYRLAGGVSTAWAGEQAGYVQHAAAEGLLLEWELDSSVVHHCNDCPDLARLPPMALDQWPTLPGDGGTECGAGCHCSMRAVAAPPPVLTAEQHEALSRVGNRQQAVAA